MTLSSLSLLKYSRVCTAWSSAAYLSPSLAKAVLPNSYIMSTQPVAGTVDDHAVFGAGLLLNLGNGGDEHRPGQGVFLDRGGGEGHPGLGKEAVLPRNKAHCSECRRDRRMVPSGDFLEEGLVDVLGLGDLRQVLQLVDPERVNAVSHRPVPAGHWPWRRLSAWWQCPPWGRATLMVMPVASLYFLAAAAEGAALVGVSGEDQLERLGALRGTAAAAAAGGESSSQGAEAKGRHAKLPAADAGESCLL